jgi:hypothetical protein
MGVSGGTFVGGLSVAVGGGISVGVGGLVGGGGAPPPELSGGTGGLVGSSSLVGGIDVLVGRAGGKGVTTGRISWQLPSTVAKLPATHPDRWLKSICHQLPGLPDAKFVPVTATTVPGSNSPMTE